MHCALSKCCSTKSINPFLGEPDVALDGDSHVAYEIWKNSFLIFFLFLVCVARA